MYFANLAIQTMWFPNLLHSRWSCHFQRCFFHFIHSSDWNPFCLFLLTVKEYFPVDDTFCPLEIASYLPRDASEKLQYFSMPGCWRMEPQLLQLTTFAANSIIELLSAQTSTFAANSIIQHWEYLPQKKLFREPHPQNDFPFSCSEGYFSCFLYLAQGSHKGPYPYGLSSLFRYRLVGRLFTC